MTRQGATINRHATTPETITPIRKIIKIFLSFKILHFAIAAVKEQKIMVQHSNTADLKNVSAMGWSTLAPGPQKKSNHTACYQLPAVK